MKFYGMINVLIVLSLAFILLEYQGQTNLFSTPFIALPLMLVLISIAMNLTEETQENSIIFGILFVLVSVFFLGYAHIGNFFSSAIGISLYVSLAVLDICGILLVIAAAFRKK
jgi:hypothetical protein